MAEIEKASSDMLHLMATTKQKGLRLVDESDYHSFKARLEMHQTELDKSNVSQPQPALAKPSQVVELERKRVGLDKPSISTKTMLQGINKGRITPSANSPKLLKR